MDEKQIKLVLGSCLHDIGKVLYRADDGRNHSQSGYDFLKEELKIDDLEILHQVRYHHAQQLKNANISNNSLAYITYIADNIASAADRRENDDKDAFGFDKNIPLESIFNVLNGNNEKKTYFPKTLKNEDGINFPTDQKVPFQEIFYKEVKENLRDILNRWQVTDSYLNSLLEVLEANLTYIPSSTALKEQADVSLFDHVKLTAAIASCIYLYLKDNQIENYEEILWKNASQFYEKDTFALISMDISGIQSFIYNQYDTEDVLKNLRARSFYLELLLENTIDNLLENLSLCRANLIYSGGGHAYILAPNTSTTYKKIEKFDKEINQWLQDVFRTDLFLAIGAVDCSAQALQNKPEGSYKNIFVGLSNILSEKKMNRYTAEQIVLLNKSMQDSEERECKKCHRSDQLTDENLCHICDGLRKLSKGILSNDTQSKKFFSIISSHEENGMPIAKDEYVIAETEEELRTRMVQSTDTYLRSYGKNAFYMGHAVSTKLWVGDYSSAQTLAEFIDKGTGIHRLGVLRADIDNLGAAFVSGFSEKHQTLSRSATFSRKLSLFFKYYINDILKHPEYSLEGELSEPRKATIIYSGGDDLFIIGAWKDILEFSVDLYHQLKRFCQGTLTISAGYTVHHDKYPVSFMAEEAGALESVSKALDGKNAITLFDKVHAYHWDEFIENVLEEKFALIYLFFSSTEKRGKNFLYNMLALMNHRDEKINLARFTYLLARLRPDKNASQDEKGLYDIFAKSMYQWMYSDKDCRETITAIYIYAYLVREEDD